MDYERLKPLLAVLLIFVGAPLAGGLLSPWVFKLVDQIPGVDFPFYRVWSRCIMLAAVSLIWPAYHISGFRSLAEIGLPRSSSKVSTFATYAFMGVLSVLAVYGLGLMLGAYTLSLPDWSARTAAYKIGGYVVGALLVGIWEEIFFRGIIFTALRRSCGLATGLLSGAFLFSVVHFMKPLNPPDVESWHAGFTVWGNIFGRAGDAVPREFCCLFLMGIALSLLFMKQRHLYADMGLHFGWVLSMMIFRKLLDSSRAPDFMISLFGVNEWISRGWLGSVLIGAFILLLGCVQLRDSLKRD
ncbi:lysostaphin resistance A-like protein [Verrucomicrobiota bacterium]